MVIPADQRFVYPGAVLCQAQDGLRCGPGAYERDGNIFASLCGKVEVFNSVIVVSSSQPGVPHVNVGNTVLGRVSRISRTQVHLDILAVDGAISDSSLRAVLRREDVFQQSLDPAEVDLTLCFKGGELVQAKVINVCDDHMRYSVTIAEPHLGLLSLAAVPAR